MSRSTRKGVLCGVSSNHELDKDSVTIKDKALLSYARQINPEFRSTTRVCRKCFAKVRNSFIAKLRRYREAKRLQNANTVSTSNEKSSTNTEESTSMFSDTSSSIRLRVNEGDIPSSQLMNSTSFSESQPTSNTTLAPAAKTARKATPAPTAKRKRDESTHRPTINKSFSSNSSLDMQPTTSAAARQHHTVAVTSSDDESEPGINVRLGKRLPGVQPAPRRRRVVLEPVAMDMYLQGITGG